MIRRILFFSLPLLIALSLFTTGWVNAAKVEGHYRTKKDTVLVLYDKLMPKAKTMLLRQKKGEKVFKNKNSKRMKSSFYHLKKIILMESRQPIKILKEETFKMHKVFTTPGSSQGTVNVHMLKKGAIPVTGYYVKVTGGKYRGKTGWIWKGKLGAPSENPQTRSEAPAENISLSTKRVSRKRGTFEVMMKSGKKIRIKGGYQDHPDKIVIKKSGGQVSYSKDLIDSINKLK